MMNIDNVERTKNNIRRAGNILPNIMKDAKINEVLTGLQALEIFNSYGITLDIILLIAHSHGVIVYEDEFNELKKEQEDRSRNCKLC